MVHRVALLSVLGALALGVALTWLLASGEAGSDRCSFAFSGGDESTAPDVQAVGVNWWPPGTRCAVKPRDDGPTQIRIVDHF